jgi:hypothetical protein
MKISDRIIKYLYPIRCDFCNGTDKEGEILYQTGDVFMNWKYHQKCLTEVVCFPEKHTKDKIRMAYYLTFAVKKRQKREQERFEHLKSLKSEYCIEGQKP